jgi:hypothetical protein
MGFVVTLPASSGCSPRDWREDTQTLDAAVGGDDNLDAQARLFQNDYFSGKRNAAFNLADQSAERGGFVGLAQIAQAGLLAE